MTSINITYDDGQGGGTTYDLTDGSTAAQGSVSFSVGGSTVTKAAKDAIVSLTATPARGYAFSSWSAYKTGDQSTTVNVNNNNQFTMPEYAVTVVANFTALTAYNLAGASSNGSVAFTVGGSTVTTAYAGETVTATATADSGYEFSSWTQPSGVTNWSATDNVATFTMPAADVSVSATFTQQTGGTMEFVQSSTSAGTLTGAPSVSPSVTATFSNTYSTKEQLTANNSMTLTISNMPSTYKITGIRLSVHNNKSAGNGTATVTMNGSTFGSETISGYSSDNGYVTIPVTLTSTPACNGDLVIQIEATVNSVFCNHFYIDYEQIPQKAYDVTVTQATGGTITASPKGEKVVDSGDAIEVTATANTGYELSAWNITNVTESMATLDTTNPATVHANGNGNVTVSATFTKVTYTISKATMSDGDVSWSGTAQMGETITVTPTASTGFKVNKVYYNDGSDHEITPQNGVYSFTMPASDVTVWATFQPGDLYVIGNTLNGLSDWDLTKGVLMNYDNSTHRYVANVYVAGENNYLQFAQGIPSGSGNETAWGSLTGRIMPDTSNGVNVDVDKYNGNPLNMDGTEPLSLTTNDTNASFWAPAGVYTLSVDLSQMRLYVTKHHYTLSFSPAEGDVDQGTSVTASCEQLVNDIAAIDANATVTVGVNTDNGSTWNTSETLNTVGSATVYGKASIGNISVTGSATYNVIIPVNPITLFHETFGSVANADDWNESYSVKSGVASVYNGITGYEVTNARLSKNTTGNGAASSALMNRTEQNVGQTASVVMGPLNVADYESLQLTYQWKPGSTKEEYWTKFYYKTSATDEFTEVTTSSTGSVAAGSYNERLFNLPSNAEVSTLYIKIEWKTSNTNGYIDDVDLQGVLKAVEPKDFAINYATVANGTASGPDGANADETVTVTVTAAENYVASGAPTVTTSDSNNPTISVTAVAGESNKYQFTVPADLAAGSTITVTPPTFEATYPITCVAEPAAGGTVTTHLQGDNTPVTRAARDKVIEVVVSPNADYQLKSLYYENIDITNARRFTMPGMATTVTANFALVPHTFTVVSEHGSLMNATINGTAADLKSATAVASDAITFKVNPDAGYAVSSVVLSYASTSQTLTASNGSYSFSMPGQDVTITVTYFASEDYELLTDLANIVDGETYLLVGSDASTYDPQYVMGLTGSGQRNAVALTGTTYDSTDKVIHSTPDMEIVSFVSRTVNGEKQYAIRTSTGKYLTNTSSESNSLSLSDDPAYATIKVNSTNGMDTIQLVDNSSRGTLSFNVSGSGMWKFYGGIQSRNYIYKIASTVKRPVIAGAAGVYLGKGNFIGTDSVTITSATEGATIYYTTNGNDPTTSSTEYTGTFALPQTALDGTVTVKAIAVSGGETSKVAEQVFTCIRPQKPTFGDNWDGESGTIYYNPMFLYPKRNTGDKDVKAYGKNAITFYYTEDGTLPTTGSTPATLKGGEYQIYLDHNVVLSVIKVINGIASEPATGELQFKVGAPTFSLPGGSYAGDQATRIHTETKSQQNNVKWTTAIYYTFDNSEFSLDDSDGTVASGWTLYDPAESIQLQAPGSKTLRAVTVANYFNGKTKWKASEISTANYVLTAANLDVIVTPAGGIYNYTKHVTFTPQNAIGTVTMTYDIHWTKSGTTKTDVTGATYNGAITIDEDAELTVHATDSRASITGSSDGSTYTKEHTYLIGVQEPMFSPLPSNIKTEDISSADYITYYVRPGDTRTAEIFSVSNNAKIYYTTDGSTPTSASTPYTGQISLTAGQTTTIKAIAYVDNKASAVHTGKYTVVAENDTTSYWYSVKEMNEDNSGKTKTFRNPIEITYMSSHRNAGSIPEFAFIRDNSGYGYIYFGGQSRYSGLKIFRQGDWLAGGTVSGKPSVWSDAYMNELGGSVGKGGITAWPDTVLTNRPIVPEYTTNRAIREGWTYEGSYSDSDYGSHVDMNKMMFGHYVHLRRNTFHDVEKWKANETPSKYIGVIKGEYGTDLCYYDGFYLYSGFNGSDIYDQTFFNNIQNKGGTFAVYGIVQFYGPNAAKEVYANQPFEIFPIAFEYIFPPIFHLEGDASAADMTNHKPERTLYQPTKLTLSCETRGAQIWYKTSDMEEFAIYDGSEITVDKSMTIETYSTHSTDKFDELISVHRTLTIEFGEVKAPTISPASEMIALVNGTPDHTVTVTITNDAESPNATIYFTVDDSDPRDEDNANRYEYTAENIATYLTDISKTTTVRAAAYDDGYYSPEAEERTYTFVKSNGIIYTLVKSPSDLKEGAVYVVVNKEFSAGIQNIQKDNNRDQTPVLFVTDAKEEVYGNEDLAVFTLHQFNSTNWILHTSNGVNNASIGYLYGTKSGSTNQLKADFTKENGDGSKYEAFIELDGTDTNVDKAYAAHIGFLKDGDPRYLRFNKSFGLFNTYTSESTGQEVFLYKKDAFPLANIEKTGVKNNEYTVADELVVVWAKDNLLWAKDQGGVSIARREVPTDQIDYMREVARSGQATDQAVVKNQEGEWDQSNWVIIELPNRGTDATTGSKHLNQFIKPAMLTGIYTDDVNYRIQVPSTVDDNTLNSWFTDGASYTPNVYCTANFLNDNLLEDGVEGSDGKTYFFMNPKVQEVAMITYAVWNGTYFVAPNKYGDAVNGANLDGAFTPDFTLNAGGTPELVPNEAYQFLGVLNTVQQPSGAPRMKAPVDGLAKSNTPDGTKKVYALNLSGDANIVTGVRNVKQNVVSRELEGIYNLQGQRVSKMEDGSFYILRYTDGTARKILK